MKTKILRVVSKARAFTPPLAWRGRADVMKSLKSALLKAAAIVALLGGSPTFAKTYDIAEIADNFAVTGSIVTDGQLGILSQSNIFSWDFNVNFFNIPFVFELSSSAPGAIIQIQGTALTADLFGLYFNFTALENDVDFFGQNNLPSLEQRLSFYSFATLGALRATSANYDTQTFLIGGVNPVGNLQFAIDPTPFSDNPVPLPGALPLFATGLGALGLLGWRRKRKLNATN